MKIYVYILVWLFLSVTVYSQSVSFQTYANPVIPGDHPDPTLTKIGDYFYTSGSSFNPTPKIYRSSDLVHWEVIAQPVTSEWSTYGNSPGGGIWGGHMVFYNGVYWHYFGRGGGAMYFVTADQPEGPWSSPTQVQVPPALSGIGLGVDNSIFIDDDGKWYMLTKAGMENNHIIELDTNGQPTGFVLDLTWLNPQSEDTPYGWAEGPVMWKYKGYYYYSFAEHLVGRQYVMRSDTLTDDESVWTVISPTDNIFTGSSATYNRPNHIAPVVMLDDSTSWTFAQSYHSSGAWYAHGRQGVFCQVTYDAQDWPVIQYPPIAASPAPDLPSNGVPWMVPKSDMFNNPELKPDWSFLGRTLKSTYSLSEREGWLFLQPYTGYNTVIQTDGEHNYSLITRLDFEPQSSGDEAGLWIINGPETLQAKVYSTKNADNQNVLAISFDATLYEVENTIGSIVWLKLVRSEHMMSGFYSSDGLSWVRIGEAINAATMDREQTQFNDFTGNQQGLFVLGESAYFDFYIYRDAYTDIAAQSPANYLGVNPGSTSLATIQNGDWAMYPGVQFGNDSSQAEISDYLKSPKKIYITASSSSNGGNVEVWLDSIDTGEKIADVTITNTGGWSDYLIFSADVTPVSGSHDVYMRFTGAVSDQLFRLKSFKFNDEPVQVTSLDTSPGKNKVLSFDLRQNYPNPFNPSTNIEYSLAENSHVILKIYNLLGQEIKTLVDDVRRAGNHSVSFNGRGLSAGVYIYQLETDNFKKARKLLLLK